MKRFFIASVSVCFLLLVGLFTFVNMQGIPQAELVQRCEESRPTWNDYQEHIKAIHAGSVAKWSGELQYVEYGPALVEVHFLLAGYWAETRAVIPILVRTPGAKTYRLIEHLERQGNLLVYVYPATTHMPSSYPWLEVHYPHTQQRVNLDANGVWRKKSGLNE